LGFWAVFTKAAFSYGYIAYLHWWSYSRSSC
jgi:hypothetical protein